MKTNINIVIVLGAAIVFLSLVGGGLHLGQKAHNHMDFLPHEMFPQEEEVIPGEVIARTLVEIMNNELNGTFGWRPNDFVLWGPTLCADNNANRQEGIIQALRETNRVFRDNLTKTSSDDFDDNIMAADVMFRNDEKKFWFPSAEGRFSKAVEALERYIAGLHSDPAISRPLNGRNVELIKLFETWTGLLGNAHANLYRIEKVDGSKVRMWETDNYFYQAQGNAAVMYYMMKAVEREYGEKLTASVKAHVHEVLEALETAAMLKPAVVLNGSAAGVTANSRRNLDAFVSEGRDKMFSIIEELKK